MVVKLTPTRRKHLEAVRDYEVWRNSEWGGGFSWNAWGPRRQGGLRRWINVNLRPSTMQWLLDNELIRVKPAVAGWNAAFRAVLTDAGRKALEVE